MDHFLKTVPKRRALFLPETLVDVISSATTKSATTKASQHVEAHGIAKALNVNTEVLLEEQQTAAALVAAEESLDITKQQEQYQKLQVDAAVKECSNFQGNHGQHENVDISRQQEELRRYEAQKKAEETNNEVSDTGRKPAEHLYDNPDEFRPRGGGVIRGTSSPPQHRHMKQEPYQPHSSSEQPLPVHAQETSQVPAPSQWQDKPHIHQGQPHGHRAPQDHASYDSRAQAHGEAYNRSYSNQPGCDPPHPNGGGYPAGSNPQVHGDRMTHPNRDVYNRHESGYDPAHYQGGAGPDQHLQQNYQAQGYSEQQLAAADALGPPTPGEVSYNLGVGSLIQLPAADGTIKYGTIKWIGLVQNVQGEIAGIEMVSS